MREDAESEVAEDDALIEPDNEQNTIGQEMRHRGLNDIVLQLQTYSSRLVLDPPIHTISLRLPGDMIRQEAMLSVENWLGYELINLPATPLSCGHNGGPLCDFCNQMRPNISEEFELPCCRLRYHHTLNNPIGGTRIPLDLHICHECMDDYVSLQIRGQYEPGYFTETEGHEVEEQFADDSSDPSEPGDDTYASSFERWFNLMRRNRRNRRATNIRSPNDDRDDVDGSECTASEEDVGNFPERGPPRDREQDNSRPEPSSKRMRLSDEEAAAAGRSSSSSSAPRLVDTAAAVPCAAATPLSLSSHPLYQQRNTNDQQNEDSDRDETPASERGGSPFQ